MRMLDYANNRPKVIGSKPHPYFAQMTDGPSGLARGPAQEDVGGAAAGASVPAHDATLHSHILQLEEKFMVAHRNAVQRSKELEATPPAHKDSETRKAAATFAPEALSAIEIEDAAVLPIPPSSPGDMELDDGAHTHKRLSRSQG
ncbi:hypothetical protein BHYA_0406g00010 [Botrytis hyacinthi]|uniref:Uncharacterized protein n=1 Tax=Botrytis hyacinthi TaxID=278943 RepID=A0A4Z1G759_9HELO|nr:hypothetical protein BHYA_0406g00010 [Botrytis hyacinthi]